MRNAPEVPLSDCPKSYARFLCEGYDSLQEAFALTPSEELVELLDRSQRAARELRDDLEGTVELRLGEERFQVHATGAKGGTRWRLSNDDFQLLIGSPKRDWTMSCRYLSAGLWEHGPSALRARAFEALKGYTRQPSPDCVRVSRADWAFDFYSPALTQELRPGVSENVVAHSSVKKFEFGTVTVGNRSQTITIGSKSNCQLQLYNKALEITEASGKTWFYPLWIEGLDGEWVWPTDRVTDVWRLEVRMAGDFLKERNIRRPHEFEEALPSLIGEALMNRRLTVPDGNDSNRGRWPLHPIWSEAYRIRAACEFIPIGRKVTGRRDALLQRAVSQLAGAARSAAVLAEGECSEAKVVQLFKDAKERITADPAHARKVEAARMRYSDVEEAR